MYTGATGHKNPPPIMPKRSMKTQEGITIGLRKGAIAQEKVSHSLLVRTSNAIVRFFKIHSLVFTSSSKFSMFQVNVIFNTCAGNLDLSAGAVSKSILEAAGQSIQDEVLQTCPNGLQVGQSVASSGGNLTCQAIVHGVLHAWDSNSVLPIQVCAFSKLTEPKDRQGHFS